MTEGKCTSSEELAQEQGYAYLMEIFKELCPEGYDADRLHLAFIFGADKALRQWKKENPCT